MSDKRTTVSKVMLTREKENEFMRRWCELAAANGGAFAVNQEYSDSKWWSTYTIEWPDGVAIPEGAKA